MLDQNLFTLNVTPREDSPLVLELIDPQGTVYYRKERIQALGGPYEFKVIDPLSESLLATITAPSASSKHKTIELYNPSVPVELKYTGTFSFRWTFKWEEHEFEWKREECFLIRKPDPPVLVAITKEPPGKIKTKVVQILDYNLKRFDIDDRKGLEIVILSALLSFQDYSDEVHANTPPLLGAPVAKASKSPEEPPPPEVPPKPKKTGAEKIAEMQTGVLGEVRVEEDGPVEDYAQYCANLLEGDNMLFVVLHSASSDTVSKVLEVAHQTKRIRHKAGLDDEGELYQYVQYDMHNSSLSGKKGPRIIHLDDDADVKNKYKPPESLTVHLSKIPLPELQPKARVQGKGREGETDVSSEEDRKKSKSSKAKGKDAKEKQESDKERRRREKEREKELLKREKGMKKEKGKDKGKTRAHSLDRDDRAASNRLAKQAPGNHVAAHRIHPNQRSPSPSQLNNPAIYAAPVPRPPPMPTLMPPPASNPYPPYPGHQRVMSSPGPPPMMYPQRSVSAYGPYPGPPPQQQQRAQTPSSMVNGLLDKLRAW
ncbi:hypothetical protein A7U60_g7498 [Sanghuangporus baumii]|uniref:Uncharacterized protein n=1 Tax=Sanghuangporus baumii TaxID=108892 RepID=A0A9Q5N615_SANBA|nr:hypothetical protein A7U60_g7498 [Sanghuangporus baumii]